MDSNAQRSVDEHLLTVPCTNKAQPPRRGSDPTPDGDETDRRGLVRWHLVSPVDRRYMNFDGRSVA
jgi:hypothetical protein